MPKFTDLIWSVTKKQAIKKWIAFELICKFNIPNYIVTINFVPPYQNLLTLLVQYTKNQAVKRWLPAKLICAVYLKYIVIINFVRPYPNLLTLYGQSLRNKP